MRPRHGLDSKHETEVAKYLMRLSEIYGPIKIQAKNCAWLFSHWVYALTLIDIFARSLDFKNSHFTRCGRYVAPAFSCHTCPGTLKGSCARALINT